jgi:hypothetical protein
MPAKFKMGVTAPTGSVVTSRLGTTGAKLVDNDRKKFVKLSGDSAYVLCDVGDPIEGQIHSLSSGGPQDNFQLGGVQVDGRISAVCDGLQATAGTGTIAIGDYVVCGTVVAAGTALGVGVFPKVCKATNQPGATVATTDNTKTNIDIALAAVCGQAKLAANGPWRVVSLGNAGAVGDTCILERV